MQYAHWGFFPRTQAWKNATKCNAISNGLGLSHFFILISYHTSNFIVLMLE